MSKKEKDRSKDLEGWQGAIKRFFGGKGGGSCCSVKIEEVKEEKAKDEAETTGKNLPDS